LLFGQLLLAFYRLQRGEQADLLFTKVFRRALQRVRRRDGELRVA